MRVLTTEQASRPNIRNPKCSRTLHTPESVLAHLLRPCFRVRPPPISFPSLPICHFWTCLALSWGRCCVEASTLVYAPRTNLYLALPAHSEMSSEIPSKTGGAAGAGNSTDSTAVSRVPKNKIDPRVKTEVRSRAGARARAPWECCSKVSAASFLLAGCPKRRSSIGRVIK